MKDVFEGISDRTLDVMYSSMFSEGLSGCFDKKVMSSYYENVNKFCTFDEEQLIFNIKKIRNYWNIPKNIKKLSCSQKDASNYAHEMCHFGIDAFSSILNKLIENETSKIKK